MPRKGENVYKRKDGRWEGRYIKSRNSAGKAVYGYVYARSYRELKTKLNDIRTNTTKYIKTSENTNCSIFTFEKYLMNGWNLNMCILRSQHI